MAGDAGRHELICRQCLATVNDVDQGLAVERESHRPAQRDPLFAHAANDRVGDIEIDREQERLGEDVARDAALRILGLELAVGEQPAGDLRPQLNIIEHAALEL